MIALLIVSVIASTIVGSRIGYKKGRQAAGLLLGLLLGWPGVLIIALIPESREGMIRHQQDLLELQDAELEAKQEAARRHRLTASR